jgi:hypothetical protein
MKVLQDFSNELQMVLAKADAYEALWKRYLKLFDENTDLIRQIKKKDVNMDVTQTPGIVPEDPISAQMAEAHGEVAPKDTPVLVKERFVQDEEMLTGTPVVM